LLAALAVLLVGLALWLWKRVPPPPPVPTAALNEILAAPAQADWRWRRLLENKAVLVIEFPNLTEQGQTMNRLAAFFEKRAGNRDHLLDDTELARLVKSSNDNVATFFFGHDYTSDQLARFFTLAEKQHLVLNGEEMRLRTHLLAEYVIKPKADGSYFSPSDQAVVSFTALQADDPATPQDETVDAQRRESVLRHELSHGEYFTNPAYRRQCQDFWHKTLSEAEREQFRHYLTGIDYDPKDEDLMINETQALLMHTPDGRAFNATDLGVSDAELTQMRDRFDALGVKH